MTQLLTRQTLNINIWAGPGIGKTTTAAGLFYRLKLAGVSAHLVPEHAKNLHYEGLLQSTSQMEIMKRQFHLQALAQGQAEVVITDAPVPLSILYAAAHERPGLEEFAARNTAGWLNFDVLLHRDLRRSYEQTGRYQTLDEAIVVHDGLTDFLRQRYGEELVEIQTDTAVDVLSYAIWRWVEDARETVKLRPAA